MTTEEETDMGMEEVVEKEVAMSDLDMMLMSVGQELKSSKGAGINKTLSSGNSNNSSSGSCSDGLLEVPGGLWTTGLGRRKRCRHSLRNKRQPQVDAETECDKGCDDKEYGIKMEGISSNEQDELSRKEDDKVAMNEKEEILKKMKNGTLDPSKNLPIEAYQIARNIPPLDLSPDSSCTDTSNMKKLKRMLQLLLLADDLRMDLNGKKQKWFDSVKLNSDGTKLIFRSFNIPRAEAFCFIVWGSKKKEDVDDNNEMQSDTNDRLDHSAVVQSEDQNFRRIVIEALQLIQ